MLYAVAMLAGVLRWSWSMLSSSKGRTPLRLVFSTSHTPNQTIYTYTQDHAPRKSGDSIREMVLHAARTSRLEAQLNNGANVPLNDLAQCRIIVGVVGFVTLGSGGATATADGPSRICHIIYHTLSRYNLLQYRALPPNGLEIGHQRGQGFLHARTMLPAVALPFRPRGG